MDAGRFAAERVRAWAGIKAGPQRLRGPGECDAGDGTATPAQSPDASGASSRWGGEAPEQQQPRTMPPCSCGRPQPGTPAAEHGRGVGSGDPGGPKKGVQAAGRVRGVGCNALASPWLGLIPLSRSCRTQGGSLEKAGG